MKEEFYRKVVTYQRKIFEIAALTYWKKFLELSSCIGRISGNNSRLEGFPENSSKY
jgi:hypothetical protein